MPSLTKTLRQTYLLTMLHLKARYRNTFAGLVWVVLSPIIIFGAQSIAFKVFLKLDIRDYPLFLLSNLLPWIFLTTSIQMCASLLEIKRLIVRSYQIQPQIFVAAQVLDNLINFVLSFIILLIPCLFISDFNPVGLLYLIPSVIILLLITLSLSILVAILQIFYRDLKFIIQFTVGVVFFITPIFYPIEYIPQEWRYIVDFNILYIALNPIHIALYNFDYSSLHIALGKALTLAIISLYLTNLLWKKKKNEFYQRV